MNRINIKALLANQNKWIAVSPNRSSILAADKSIKELEAKLSKMRIKDATISFVPPANKYLSP